MFKEKSLIKGKNNYSAVVVEVSLVVYYKFLKKKKEPNGIFKQTTLFSVTMQLLLHLPIILYTFFN